jgi:hypothetical protein
MRLKLLHTFRLMSRKFFIQTGRLAAGRGWVMRYAQRGAASAGLSRVRACSPPDARDDESFSR